jgi:hypothetical protein
MSAQFISGPTNSLKAGRMLSASYFCAACEVLYLSQKYVHVFVLKGDGKWCWKIFKKNINI